MAAKRIGLYRRADVLALRKKTRKMISVTEACLKYKERLLKRTKKELEIIIKKEITDFYKSYKPSIYNRQGRLYKVPHIIVTDDTIKVVYDNSEAGYDDYVYHIVFEEGWHGGVPRTSMEDLWYRFERNGKEIWLSPAVRHTAPQDNIEEETTKCLDAAVEEYNQRVYEPIRKVIEEYVAIIKRMLNDGGVSRVGR